MPNEAVFEITVQQTPSGQFAVLIDGNQIEIYDDQALAEAHCERLRRQSAEEN